MEETAPGVGGERRRTLLLFCLVSIFPILLSGHVLFCLQGAQRGDEQGRKGSPVVHLVRFGHQPAFLGLYDLPSTVEKYRFQLESSYHFLIASWRSRGLV